MLPNEMVLAPLQKLKIKYELSYQSTTRLSHCYWCLCHVNRIHTCNTINILIGHQLFNDDFINDGKCSIFHIFSLFNLLFFHIFQLTFLPEFPYLFTIQLTFLPHFPYLFTIQLTFLP
jgi:hypothetical protein